MVQNKTYEYVVYTKDNCPNCEKALSLLRLYEKPIRVVNLGTDTTMQYFRAAHPTIRTVPFITFGHAEFTSVIRLGQHLRGDDD